jgi:tRNA uridine 5-carboxymethylaminomethyl modification enzyme
MFNGRIQGLGPRYCPSIEDKINRFAERDRHQIFIEPEGRNTIEVYVNGFSTSLPDDIQFKALRLVPGFENAKLFRPGYAIEYDYFPPVQLALTLETHLVGGLFFAGQINGTTGYEEAAAQGLMAGINAARKVKEEEGLVLGRDEAYIGVLIDDLVTKGTEEPYRMFTSRAEYRILLRQDNADSRLTRIGHRVGLASEQRVKTLDIKEERVMKVLSMMQEISCDPLEYNAFLAHEGSSPLSQKVKFASLLSRPELTLQACFHGLPSLNEHLGQFTANVLEEAEIQLKYAGYILKEREFAKKLGALEKVRIQPGFSYESIKGLSSEAREKLTRMKPGNLGQASRISGVSPADVSVLMVYLGR